MYNCFKLIGPNKMKCPYCYSTNTLQIHKRTYPHDSRLNPLVLDTFHILCLSCNNKSNYYGILNELPPTITVLYSKDEKEEIVK